MARSASNSTTKQSTASKPLVLITGAGGNLGQLLSRSLQQDYMVIGLDRPKANEAMQDHSDQEIRKSQQLKMDVTSPASVKMAMDRFKDVFGDKVAAVIHLAAYFDFSGEPSPLYEQVNEQGTRNLLQGLRELKIERFIYTSTMLVHKPVKPGEYINEDSPIEPGWAYPQSKANTESIIQQEHGDIPVAVLRLGGVYGDDFAVPTLAHQIARIYEQDLKSILYSGDVNAGQAFLHQDDLVSLFASVIAKRNALPEYFVALAGEEQVASYKTLQNKLGELIHGSDHWHTILVPKLVAKGGAWLEEKSEPVIPDDFDRGEKPFIKPFMIDMASDHYALSIRRAQESLDWYPKRRLLDKLPLLVDNLKNNPLAWYRTNHILAPDWMQVAGEKNKNPQKVRDNYERYYHRAHRDNLWAPFANMALGLWLVFSPFTLGYSTQAMRYSDFGSGIAVMVLAAMTLSVTPWGRLSRWALAVVGVWVATAPLVFWSPDAAAYLNGTLVGAALLGFAFAIRPFPHLSPVAFMTGPDIPPGWNYSPSDWLQRLPIIVLAVVGLLISRYMAAYQLGQIDSVWEPFFQGPASDTKNGTEEIITSSVSEAWPVPDAGLGALVYLLEILTGALGSRRRWRTMPWLVLLFGFMIVPLGIVSISFIIIQPILLGTWCTLCLLAAAAMLLQIPYSFDEIIATVAFLKRRAKKGRPWMLIMFTGDSDEEVPEQKNPDDFRQSPGKILREMVAGGVSCPWPLAASALIGVWLMCTRLTIGAEGQMANADHVIGALVLTVTVTATAEVTRPVRFINALLGMALMIMAILFSATMLQTVLGVMLGLALILLSLPRGPITNRYGGWTRIAKL